MWMTPVTRRFYLLASFAFFAVNLSIPTTSSFAAATEAPRLIVLQPADLMETRKRLQANDASLAPALNRLKRDADRALAGGPFSVTHKELVAPSGDKRDYMSIAPYWWPNPSTPNGLPYLRRDGEVNPERDQTSDRKRLDSLVQGVKTLAFAYFFTGGDAYAGHAAKLLRVWFLDSATGMNPHLRYAQAVPGRNLGRGAGIIESHNLPELLDGVGMLAGSSSWSGEDQRGLQKWFDAYLDWLQESPEGKTEAKTQNNHGSWYDVQIAAFALFVDKSEVAKKVLSEMARARLAKQIEPDGRQRHELERTQAWSYSLFNLEAFFSAAAIADKLVIDLWNYRTADKRSLRAALDWLLPFATGEKKWSYPQLSGMQPEKLAPLLRQAALRYREPAYEQAIGKLPKLTGDERWRLLYPKES